MDTGTPITVAAAGRPSLAVVVNRTRAQVTSQLGHADRAHAVDLTWGDLENGLRGDLIAPFTEMVLVTT
jgi:hypothetical protein